MRSFVMWLRVVGWSHGVEPKRNTMTEAWGGAVVGWSRDRFAG